MAILEKYKKHRWKFLLFGAISGVLMGVYAPNANGAGVAVLSDLLGGLLLWYILWWLWARSKSRAQAADDH